MSATRPCVGVDTGGGISGPGAGATSAGDAIIGAIAHFCSAAAWGAAVAASTAAAATAAAGLATVAGTEVGSTDTCCTAAAETVLIVPHMAQLVQVVSQLINVHVAHTHVVAVQSQVLPSVAVPPSAAGVVTTSPAASLALSRVSLAYVAPRANKEP